VNDISIRDTIRKAQSSFLFLLLLETSQVTRAQKENQNGIKSYFIN